MISWLSSTGTSFFAGERTDIALIVVDPHVLDCTRAVSCEQVSMADIDLPFVMSSYKRLYF